MCRDEFVVSCTNREYGRHEMPDEAFMVLSRGNDIMLKRAGEGYELPRWSEVAPLLSEDVRPLCAGEYGHQPCCGVELPREGWEVPAFLEPLRVRDAFQWADAWLVMAISRTRELTSWRNAHRYCGRCRRELQCSGADLGLVCACGTRYYPQIAPAVIVAISRHDGQELLLAHNRHFEAGIYGLIAGFVEAGETVEQAVSREIREETGIEVKNIHYLYSQPWPFPNSLMLAFTAEYASGEAKADGEELSDLGWYDRDSLPALPRTGSVARRVIEGFFRKESSSSLS